MFTALTVLTGLVGAGVVGVGLSRYLRGRFGMRARQRAMTGQQPSRRGAVAMTALGTLLMVIPELPSILLFDNGFGAFGTVMIWIYRVLAVGGLSLVWLSMALTSDAVTRPVSQMTNDALDGLARVVPFGDRGVARQLRRDPAYAQLPNDWDAVVAQHGTLSRELLDYQMHADLGANLPAMRDLNVPTTAAAWAAMTRCDELRSSQPPTRVRDVVLTDYAQAVGEFTRAMSVARETAQHLATGQVSPAEQQALDEAQKTLAFLQTSAASPAERAQAYETLVERLHQVRPATDGSGERAHPWLDVADRARH